MKLENLIIGAGVAVIVFSLIALYINTAKNTEKRPPVTEIYLSDGTFCALPPNGGIACNWKETQK